MRRVINSRYNREGITYYMIARDKKFALYEEHSGGKLQAYIVIEIYHYIHDKWGWGKLTFKAGDETISFTRPKGQYHHIHDEAKAWAKYRELVSSCT